METTPPPLLEFFAVQFLTVVYFYQQMGALQLFAGQNHLFWCFKIFFYKKRRKKRKRMQQKGGK